MKKINIRPTVAIFDSYERIDYDVSTAMLEFIDNSIASFENYKDKLKKSIPSYILNIDIYYDRTDPKNPFLEIVDNAMGMDDEEIERATKLYQTNTNKNSLNKYGFGLKTGAFWFGKRLTIKTSKLGIGREFSLVMDATQLKQNPEEDSIALVDSPVEKKFTILL